MSLRWRRVLRRHLVAIFLVLAVGGPVVACTADEPTEDPAARDASRWEWTSKREAEGFEKLEATADTCSDCVAFEQVALIGASDQGGFLEEATADLVRDAAGNYWIGQTRGVVKVFGPTGRFIREIGQPGQGPTDFGRPKPFHVDAQGRVHILDAPNTRIAVYGADFELDEVRPLPGYVTAASPVADGERYVSSMWLQTVEQLGLPLHIYAGSTIVDSFGWIPTPNAEPLTRATAQRILHSSGSGPILSAASFSYSIEAWTQEGERIFGFEGPSLMNSPQVALGQPSPDGTPPNHLLDMRVDADGRVWTLVWERAPDWKANADERITPDGRVVLVPSIGNMAALYRPRLDVIDLDSGAILAMASQERLIVKLLDDGLAVAVVERSDGNAQLAVWKTTLLH